MENSEKDRLRKGIECVKCEFVLSCKGAKEPKQCLNFKERKKK